MKIVVLDELLNESDFISLHCPLTPETNQLIDAKKINKMKSSAFLINTSRGALINEAVLADALNSRKIAGAGLNVLPQEPPMPDNPHIDMSGSDDHKKFKVISTEAKNLWDLADSIFWNSRKKLIAIFREHLPNERDLLPVFEAITKSKGKVKSTEDSIIVKLEPLERPQFRHAQEQLCRHLNQMNVKLHNSKTLMFDVG